jgi:hypothetical protein
MSGDVHRGDQHPKPGTPEYAQLERELEFSLIGIDAPTKKALRERLAAHILRFMVRRNCWPVGTRVKVTRNYGCETVFPD